MYIFYYYTYYDSNYTQHTTTPPAFPATTWEKWIKRLTHVKWITLRLKSSWIFWLQLFSSELLSLWMISHFNTMKGSEKRSSNISCLLLSLNIFVMAPFKKPITRNRINNFKVHVSRKARNSQLTGFLFRIFTGHVTLIYSASHPVYNVYLLLLYLLWLKLHTTYYYPTRLSSHYLGKMNKTVNTC